MKTAGKTQFSDADLQALAKGEGDFASASPEQQAAAQELLNNDRLRLAMDVFGKEGGAKMDGAQDGAYWTATVANPDSIDNVVGAYRNLAGNGSLSTNAAGDATIGGQNVEQALGRETPEQTQKRQDRQLWLNTFLGADGLAQKPDANGKQGFSKAQLEEAANKGTVNGVKITTEEQQAAKKILGDPSLLKVIDNVGADGTLNDANGDSWYNIPAIKNQMTYILRYAAAEESKQASLA